jgi:hypothetical protein
LKMYSMEKAVGNLTSRPNNRKRSGDMWMVGEGDLNIYEQHHNQF